MTKNFNMPCGCRTDEAGVIAHRCREALLLLTEAEIAGGFGLVTGTQETAAYHWHYREQELVAAGVPTEQVAGLRERWFQAAAAERMIERA